MNLFTTILEEIRDLPGQILRLFAAPKAQAAIKEAERLALYAAPIVQAIAALAPNQTVQEAAAAYAHYAVPLAHVPADNPVLIGNALLNLATEVLKANHAPRAAVSVLNTAVQLAVLAVKTPEVDVTPGLETIIFK